MGGDLSVPPSVCNPGEGKRNEDGNREARSERFEEEKIGGEVS